jgi:hypothetical protein
MSPPAITPDLRAAAPLLAGRFAAIVADLVRIIAQAFLRTPRAGLILPVCLYLTRTAHRFTRLNAHVAAGRPPRRRPSRPHATQRPARPAPFPRGHAWLLPALGDLRHHGAAHRNRIEALLATPEAAALLQAAPSAGRLLRPLCHMLALRPAVLYPAKPPRPEPEKSAPPPAPPPAPIAAPAAPWPPEPPCPRLRRRWPWSALRAQKPA